MGSILSGLAAGLRFLADFFDAENSADVKAAKVAQQHQDLKDQIGQAVKDGNIDKVKDLLAQ